MVMLSAIVMMVAAAAVSADPTATEAAARSSDWISGSTLIAIISAICGGGGVLYGRAQGQRRAEEAERRKISGMVDLPQPLQVDLKEKFVTRHEYDDFKAGNRKDHENIFCRLTDADRTLGSIQGLLEGIRGDLTLIKGKLFRK